MTDISREPDRAEGCAYIWAPKWRQTSLLTEQLDEEVNYFLSTQDGRLDDPAFELWAALRVYIITSDGFDMVMPILANKQIADLPSTVVVAQGPFPDEQAHAVTELSKTLATLGATVCQDLDDAAEFINDFYDELRMRAEVLDEIGPHVWED